MLEIDWVFQANDKVQRRISIDVSAITIIIGHARDGCCTIHMQPGGMHPSYLVKESHRSLTNRINCLRRYLNGGIAETRTIHDSDDE